MAFYLNILKNYIFFRTMTNKKPFSQNFVSFTYIFVKFFFNANKQKYIYSTQIQKKAISKFKKKRNNNIFYEKN